MSWLIEETGFQKEKIEFFGNKFCIGNGYFGYRGCLEEYRKEQLAACTVSEIYDDSGSGWRELVNIPNPCYTLVSRQDIELSVLHKEALTHVQQLDLMSGLHKRETVFLMEDGSKITLRSERFASIDDIHILAMRYSLVANEDMDVNIITGIDTEIWDINGPHFKSVDKSSDEKLLGLKLTTNENKRIVAVAETIKILGEAGVAEYNKKKLMHHISAKLCKGVAFVFEKFIAVYKDTDSENPMLSANKVCRQAYESGYSTLLQRQKAAWKKRWKKFHVSITGDDQAQLAIRYSMYLLLICAPFHTDKVAIPARGLSGQVYKGAMFWDTEIYMLPMLAYCEPEVARNVMMYRVHNLKGACKKAEEYDYYGAFYPWESQETGEDGCTHYNLVDIFTGRKMRTYFRDKQIHISADVVYGLWKYMDITGDREILLKGGAEVILECARFFYSYAYYKKDKERYEFLDVTGADEYHERINNDAYTNYMIKLALKCAVDTIEYLKKCDTNKYSEVMQKLNFEKDVENIQSLYEHIYLPSPNGEKLIEQFDGYFKQEDVSVEELYQRIIKPNEYLGSPCGLAVNTQILKQADVVLLLSILGEEFDKETKKKNWAYYEPRTEHGSSLSTCIYALLAAEIGETKWAYEYFMKAACLDMEGSYKLYLGNLYIGGTHPAANGGSWMVAVNGFGGLHCKKDGVKITPCLPAQWKQLEYSFVYRRNTYTVTADRQAVILKSAEENTGILSVELYDKLFICNPGEVLKQSCNHEDVEEK